LRRRFIWRVLPVGVDLGTIASRRAGPATQAMGRLIAQVALIPDARALFAAEAVVQAKRRGAIVEGLIAQGHSARQHGAEQVWPDPTAIPSQKAGARWRGPRFDRGPRQSARSTKVPAALSGRPGGRRRSRRRITGLLSDNRLIELDECDYEERDVRADGNPESDDAVPCEGSGEEED
jgi:hypothetical protein